MSRSGDLVGTNDSHYYKAYVMPASGGQYSLTLNAANAGASRTGAYRLTARYRLIGQFLRCVMDAAHDLFEGGRIDRIHELFCPDVFAVNNQRVFAAQLGFDLLQRFEHPLRVSFVAEIGERFVLELRKIEHKDSFFAG